MLAQQLIHVYTVGGAGVEGLRAVEAAVRADQAVECNNARFELLRELAAAQAIIAHVREKALSTGDRSSVLLAIIREILSQSPTDALQAHDRQVAVKAIRDWADYQERVLSDFDYALEDGDEAETKAWCKAARYYADAVESGRIPVSPAESTPELPEGENR